MVRSAIPNAMVLGLTASLLVAGVAASAELAGDDGGPDQVAANVGITSDVVFSSDFEDGSVQGWFGRGSAAVAATDAEANTGEHSLVTTGRADTWQGPGRDLRDVLQPGVGYEIEAYVRLADAPTAVLHMTVQRTPAGGDTAFERVASDVTVTDDGWTRIAGTYAFTSAEHDELQLYLESVDPAVSFYLDDVTITGAVAGGDVLISSDFEDGLDGWGPRGDGTDPQVSLTTDGDPRGTQSALVTGRTQAWHGIGHDVTALFSAGATVNVSAWVKLAPGATPDVADIRVSVQRDAGGSSSFDTVATVAGVTADTWIEVSASYTPGTFESALLYVETTSALSDFMVDDILVTGSSASIDPDIPSLRDVVPVPFGVAIDGRETVGASSELVLKHFSQITPENHMKPVEIQPAEGTFTFDQADELMQFAQDNDLAVYGHTLLWHSQVGAWMFQDADGAPLTDSAADQELLRERMRIHIETFADHFRSEFGEYGDENPLVAIDVVNEVISESEPDGLRRSEWYRILGPDYIPLAFEYAREAFGPDVQLFINDFNTELPAKRQVYYDRIVAWLDDSVPIDGVGHQLHLSLLQPIPQIAASLELFRDLPVVQAVTELDVTINIAGETWTVPPVERLVEQGYYYRDLFDVLSEHYDVLSAITVWGPTDPRSWRAGGFPLLFDGNLQAKPAYWGIADPAELPTLTRQVNVHAGDVALDESATTAGEWELLPDVTVGTAGSGFQLRWSPDRLVAYVSVADTTDDGASDIVEFFWGGDQLAVPRTGGASAVVSSTAEGYQVVAHLPAQESAEGAVVPFDIRLTDGATGTRTSWNDLEHGQEDGERLGVLTLIEPVGYVEVPHTSTAPAIDGEVDALWESAPVVSTDVQVEGSPGASAEVRLLWSGPALYALAEVTDPSLDAANSNAWEQDSVEFFVDPTNAKSGAFNPVDGQYRVNFENAVSIAGEAPVQDRLTSATSITDTGYLVEVAIDLGYEPDEEQLVGLELQVNDATNGARNSVRTWSDPTGRSFQNTSRWGVARLVGGDDGGEPEPQCDRTIDGVHNGPVTITAGVTCLVEDSRIRGPVTVAAGAGLVASGAAVTGPVTATAADTVVIHDSTLTGPVTISGTTSRVSLIDNHVIGPVRLADNSTGSEPITVSGNTIMGVLSCSGNSPEPSNGGNANTVVGVKKGQCHSL
jgi:endo-1,4-beta-xylanase